MIVNTLRGNSHNIDQVIPEYSGISLRNVNRRDILIPLHPYKMASQGTRYSIGYSAIKAWINIGLNNKILKLDSLGIQNNPETRLSGYMTIIWTPKFKRELNKYTALWLHDDVIKWKHFPRYWPFVRRIHRSPVNSPHKGQWRGALMFSLICVWINGWVNSREAGDLRRYHAHYNVIVIIWDIYIRSSRQL